MIERTTNGNYQATVIDGEFIADQRAQGSSPTRRTAAYPSDIELVGRSQAFTEVVQQVDRVAATDLPVLLTGESGSGKGLVAVAIHHHSARADQPFVAVNCGATSAESIEVELFGEGTLFLNEISETSASFQELLALALQTGEIRRAGSTQPQRLNVRVIAGSSRYLDQEVAAGKFRSDLYYRLHAAAIALPPLRDRVEDIPQLAQSFADRVFSLRPPVKFAPEALSLLERYGWPGNIRELEQAVVRAAVLCDGTIRVKDLPQRVRNYTQKQQEHSDSRNGFGDGVVREEWVPLSEIEGRYVAQVLEHTRGNKQAAARVLAVDRKTLDRMIKRHHIDSAKVRRAAR